MKDLVVLAPCKSIKLVMDAVLGRPAHLGIRMLTFSSFVHEKRDPGVCLDAHHFLRAQHREYGFAIAICDFEGSGQKSRSRNQIEERIEMNLSANGWEKRAAAIIIHPELENWMWGDWKATSSALGWADTLPLRDWLKERTLLKASEAKPRDPKEALEAAARYVGKPFSSAIHQQIAAEARFDGCTDPAFLKLRSVLQTWFPLAT